MSNLQPSTRIGYSGPRTNLRPVPFSSTSRPSRDHRYERLSSTDDLSDNENDRLVQLALAEAQHWARKISIPPHMAPGQITLPGPGQPPNQSPSPPPSPPLRPSCSLMVI
jgi:hypothetical protein